MENELVSLHTTGDASLVVDATIHLSSEWSLYYIIGLRGSLLLSLQKLQMASACVVAAVFHFVTLY